MSYSDARDRGYDGPDPFTERLHRKRVERNNMLDCRDPDHDSNLCPICGEQETEENDE
jgi:hypothetical protein